MLRTKLARQRVVARASHCAKEDRIGFAGERERSVGQRMSRSLVTRAADRRRLRFDRQVFAREDVQDLRRFADDLGTDAVARQNRNLHLHLKKKRRLSSGAASLLGIAHASQGCSASRFVSNARISSACAKVNAMSS